MSSLAHASTIFSVFIPETKANLFKSESLGKLSEEEKVTLADAIIGLGSGGLKDSIWARPGDVLYDASTGKMEVLSTPSSNAVKYIVLRFITEKKSPMLTPPQKWQYSW
jgi:hypothetical protein